MRTSTWVAALMTTLGVLGVGGGALAEPAGAETDARGEMVWRLHTIHYAEIGMAKLEAELARSSDVRAFAYRLLHDHRAANKALLSYAADAELRIAPAMGAQKSDRETQSMLDALRGARPTEVDRTFLTMMVQGHREAIDFVRHARDSTGDKDLQKLLDDLLPTLQRHRDAALTLQAKLRARPPVRSSKR